MRKLLVILLFALVAAGCGDTDTEPNNAGVDAGTSTPDAATEPVVPVGTSEATYDWEQREIVYGQGQTHANWNDDNPTVIDLEATVWDPQDTPGTRPALMIVHGGGFIGGTRMQADLVEFAEYFAARGWFVISISYRLLGDKPTMPQAWEDGVESSELADILKQLGRTIYGSVRDAKAAVRYLQANAGELDIDPDSIAVMGGSAGSIVSIALGVTEPEDFRDELIGIDPTLESTHLEQDGRVAAVLDHWGSARALEGLDLAYGLDRWDATDAPIQIMHGTEDSTVTLEEGEYVRDKYIETGAPYTFYPIEGAGHGPWDAEIEGRSIIEIGFEFAAEHQGVLLD